MSSPISANWIISRREDLGFLILSSFGAYILLGLMLASPTPLLVWFLWVALLDTPHYFGTYSRAYLDPATRSEHPGRFRVSHALLAFGPGVVLLCWLLHNAGVEEYRRPYVIFLFAFNLWAFWHLVRQHYGIMALYERKGSDREAADLLVDRLILYGGLLGSLGILGLRHPEARAGLGLEGSPAPYSELLDLGLRARADLLLTAVVWAIIVVSVLSFAARQGYLLARGRTINGPKVLLLFTVVSSFVFVCAYEPGHRLPLLVWSGVITIGHDIQYLAFVYFQHRRRYHQEPTMSPSAAPWAQWVSASPLRFLGAALFVGASLRLLGAALGVFPGLPALFESSGLVLFGDFRLQELLFASVLGIAMQHYWLDQFLWRPSRDVGLRRDLGVAG